MASRPQFLREPTFLRVKRSHKVFKIVFTAAPNSGNRTSSQKAGFIYKGEYFNSITHLVGASFAVVGASVLITLSAATEDPWKIASVSIYGVVLFLLYLASTLFHSFQGRPKAIFAKLDHLAIYLLIAGSYTPFALVSLRGPLGWWIFGINWGLAIFGILYELFLSHRSRIPSFVTYMVMGWMALIAAQPLYIALGLAGMLWLAIGGLFYTIGFVFYAYDDRIQHFHGIWHLFVLAGSICHYFCIALYVI